MKCSITAYRLVPRFKKNLVTNCKRNSMLHVSDRRYAYRFSVCRKILIKTGPRMTVDWYHQTEYDRGN